MTLKGNMQKRHNGKITKKNRIKSWNSQQFPLNLQQNNTIKHMIMRLLLILSTLLMAISLNAQVQNTPSIIDSKPTDIWQFIQSIGYTKDYTVKDTIIGNDLHLRYYTASNPNDNSSVRMTTDISEDSGEGIWHIVYSWKKKKDMPKGLEKLEFKTVKRYNEFEYGKGRYKKHYICSIMGNPMQKHIGSFRSNSFNIVVNGTTYTGYY